MQRCELRLAAIVSGLAGTPGCFSEASDSSGTGTATADASTSVATAHSQESSTLESGSVASNESAPATDVASADDETTTGEPATTWALAFEGGIAVSGVTPTVEFDGAPYTIELWLFVDADAQGILFDTTVTVAGPNGVTLVRDPAATETDEFVFFDFGVSPALQLEGSNPSRWSPTWHHYAIVCDATMVSIWRDGQPVGSIERSMQADNAQAPVAIGSQPTTPFVPLSGVMLDELRISRALLYTEPFTPSRPLGGNGAALYWDFEEGDGLVAVDQIEGLELAISGAVFWEAVE